MSNKIEGVQIKKLVTHGDQRGFFREIFRFSEEFGEKKVGQLSHSLVKGGVVKAWHGHQEQSQWNYVVLGKIKVALYDNRKNSSTHKNIAEFVCGDDCEPIAYFFPPGVLHGYKCIKGPMHIIYTTSGTYDLEDEIRVSSDDSKINFDWLQY